MQLTNPLASDSKKQEPPTKTQKKYVYDNDGHFGAFISYLILQKYAGKNLLGVSLTSGDSLTHIATQSFRRLFCTMNASPHFAVKDKEAPNPLGLNILLGCVGCFSYYSLIRSFQNSDISVVYPIYKTTAVPTLLS